MEVRELLRKNGIKATNGRKIIYGILEKSEKPLNAEEIFIICKQSYDKVDLSTVYRTLELFEGIGLVDRMNLGDDKFSYIMKRDEHKHMLECRICHKEIEIDCPVRQVKEMLKNQTGFTFEDCDALLKDKIEGVCKECSKDEEK